MAGRFYTLRLRCTGLDLAPERRPSAIASPRRPNRLGPRLRPTTSRRLLPRSSSPRTPASLLLLVPRRRPLPSSFFSLFLFFLFVLFFAFCSPSSPVSVHTSQPPTSTPAPHAHVFSGTSLRPRSILISDQGRSGSEAQGRLKPLGHGVRGWNAIPGFFREKRFGEPLVSAELWARTDSRGVRIW
jgi:hypothetical protein